MFRVCSKSFDGSANVNWTPHTKQLAKAFGHKWMEKANVTSAGFLKIKRVKFCTPKVQVVEEECNMERVVAKEETKYPSKYGRPHSLPNGQIKIFMESLFSRGRTSSESHRPNSPVGAKLHAFREAANKVRRDKASVFKSDYKTLDVMYDLGSPFSNTKLALLSLTDSHGSVENVLMNQRSSYSVTCSSAHRIKANKQSVPEIRKRQKPDKAVRFGGHGHRASLVTAVRRIISPKKPSLSRGARHSQMPFTNGFSVHKRVLCLSYHFCSTLHIIIIFLIIIIILIRKCYRFCWLFFCIAKLWRFGGKKEFLYGTDSRGLLYYGICTLHYQSVMLVIPYIICNCRMYLLFKGSIVGDRRLDSGRRQKPTKCHRHRATAEEGSLSESSVSSSDYDGVCIHFSSNCCYL